MTPMRRISNVEYQARQIVLRTLAPACVAAAHRASLLAETRFRRSFATQRHVRGCGIEVGAAATPALVPRHASVKYVDKYPIAHLEADPELKGLKFPPPDIIASAETLEAVPSRSQDFVLAFSLLEHVQDVLGSLSSFCRVTRAGGSIVVSVPDKRLYGPDKLRDITPFEHFVRDYREGPEWSRADHFREVGRVRLNLAGDELESFVNEKIAQDAHTHFHVWSPDAFLRMLIDAKSIIGVDYEIVEFASYGHEALAVLKVPAAEIRS